MAWMLYIPRYVGYLNRGSGEQYNGYERIAVQNEGAKIGECWSFRDIKSKVIIVCGNFYIREE